MNEPQSAPRYLAHMLRLLLTIALLLALFGLARTANAQGAVHTVAPGETLSEIAQRYGTDMATLVSLNGLSNPRTIWVGQALRLPGYAAASAPRVGGTTYIVQPGDSLSAIAAAAGLSLQELAAMNNIPPLTRVIVGQSLTVPAGFRASAGASQTLQGREQMHVVAPGESLGSIANAYGSSIEAIAQRNGIANPSLVQVGQKLVVPDAVIQAKSGAYGEGFPANLSFPPTGGKWIRVDLSTQRLTAYVGATAQQTFVISSGTAKTPTVTGTFRIWAKLTEQDMKGGSRFAGTDYDLPDVPWVQYFHQDYAFHGAYWHNNFGTPMSNGCINMRIADAKWLFDWAGPTWHGGWQEATAENPGTLVIVHQ
jgi:LysM repeat protein